MSEIHNVFYARRLYHVKPSRRRIEIVQAVRDLLQADACHACGGTCGEHVVYVESAVQSAIHGNEIVHYICYKTATSARIFYVYCKAVRRVVESVTDRGYAALGQNLSATGIVHIYKRATSIFSGKTTLFYRFVSLHIPEIIEVILRKIREYANVAAHCAELFEKDRVRRKFHNYVLHSRRFHVRKQSVQFERIGSRHFGRQFFTRILVVHRSYKSDFEAARLEKFCRNISGSRFAVCTRDGNYSHISRRIAEIIGRYERICLARISRPDNGYGFDSYTLFAYYRGCTRLDSLIAVRVSVAVAALHADKKIPRSDFIARYRYARNLYLSVLAAICDVL